MKVFEIRRGYFKALEEGHEIELYENNKPTGDKLRLMPIVEDYEIE